MSSSPFRSIDPSSAREVAAAPAGIAPTGRDGARGPWWHRPLLMLHVAATVGLLGADLALITLSAAGASGVDPRTIYPAAALLAAQLIAPLALTSLGTGVLLGLLTPFGLIRHAWVAIKLAITAILTGVVMFVLVPGLERAALTVTSAGAATLTDAARLRFAIAPAIASVLLALNIALAMYKPRWRFPGARKNSHASGHAGTVSIQQENPR